MVWRTGHRIWSSVGQTSLQEILWYEIHFKSVIMTFSKPSLLPFIAWIHSFTHGQSQQSCSSGKDSSELWTDCGSGGYNKGIYLLWCLENTDLMQCVYMCVKHTL